MKMHYLAKTRCKIYIGFLLNILISAIKYIDSLSLMKILHTVYFFQAASYAS